MICKHKTDDEVQAEQHPCRPDDDLTCPLQPRRNVGVDDRDRVGGQERQRGDRQRPLGRLLPSCLGHRSLSWMCRLRLTGDRPGSLATLATARHTLSTALWLASSLILMARL